jgi:SagB-type dehydrogenase family enzyme
LRAPRHRQATRVQPSGLLARVNTRVTLAMDTTGKIAASIEGRSAALATLSPGATERALLLRTGLPLASFASARRSPDKEIDGLVRRLARLGLLEYVLRRPRDDTDLAVIEPQVADYWPRMSPLRDSDIVVLSRFAYLRRRANDLVLESPRAGALFRICDPQIAAALAMLSAPQPIKRLHRRQGFPGRELLALLLDCQMLFKIGAAGGSGLRPDEGGGDLVLWDFHDLVFHARSTQGRHANPLGGVYSYADAAAPQLAVRPVWPGAALDLRSFLPADARNSPPMATLLRERRSIRSFDDGKPITIAELSQFLDGTARVLATLASDPELDDGGHTVRPYPSAGASYELELYLAVRTCEGLPGGFYHYDAGAHALTGIGATGSQLEALLTSAAFAMGVTTLPQVLITIAARFARVGWKYSAIAYSLILKDVGVLTQTFYLMATAMGLGGCAIGSTDIELFANMTGLEFHVEGAVGQFALGRGAAAQPAK